MLSSLKLQSPKASIMSTILRYTTMITKKRNHRIPKAPIARNLVLHSTIKTMAIQTRVNMGKARTITPMDIQMITMKTERMTCGSCIVLNRHTYFFLFLFLCIYDGVFRRFPCRNQAHYKSGSRLFSGGTSSIGSIASGGLAMFCMDHCPLRLGLLYCHRLETIGGFILYNR